MADKVCIAYVHGLEVAYSFHQSIMGLIAYDVAHHQRVIGGGWMAVKYGTGGIVQARNDATRQFLDGTDSDWMMWIDTDMGFAPDSVDRLLEVAHPTDRPVVGGLCFMNREVGLDGLGGRVIQPMPTIFQWAKVGDAEGFSTVMEYPRDEVIPAAATGSAFILIHRSAFEAVRQQYGATWYSPVFNESAQMWISEDLSFCTRLGALEIPIHIHTGVKTNHLKHVWIDETVFDRMERISDPTRA